MWYLNILHNYSGNVTKVIGVLLAGSINIFAQSNSAPIVNAGADQNITLPSGITLNGSATDDGIPGALTVTWTQVNGPIGVTFSNPNTAVTSAVFPAAGTYTLRLTATDGQLTTSDDVVIRTASSSGTNQPPIITAGPDKVITLPINTVTLNGSATDDGLPVPPGGVNINWLTVTAPQPVTFSNVKTPTTNVTFTAAGTYILRMRAADGAFVLFDTVKVTVNPQAGSNRPPVVNAGTDQNITLPNGASLNGSATDDGIPGALTVTWTQVNGPIGVTFSNPNTAVTSAVFPAAGTYTLRLTATDGQLTTSDDVVIRTASSSGTNQPPIITAGPDKVITLPINTVTLNGSATDDGLPVPPGGVNINWLTVTAPQPVTFSNVKTPTTNVTFTAAGTYILRMRAADGAFVLFDTVRVTVNPAGSTNQAPIVNAGTDKTITLPTNTIAMTGTASDDGLPNPPGTLTINWSQLNGPGTVTFQNVNSLTTNVTFPSAGTYNLRLTANDSQLSKADTMQVIVNQGQVPQNQAPVVNAGADQNITLPNGATLNGSATDDGIPGALTVTWTQVNGPIGVTFSNPNTAVTSAVFPAAGTFTLRLTATDGQLTTSDDVVIRTASSSGTNQPPIITAGPDKVTTLPVNTVTLNGSATDDGLPVPPAGINVNWLTVTAPQPVTFSNVKLPTTNVTFTAVGTYILRMRVADGTFVLFDTVLVIVKPAPEIPNSLKSVQVPGPDKVIGFDFTQFVVNKDAAVKLGKALFWDMQAGSDSIQACASCHFNAGADIRVKNQLNPGISGTFFTGKGSNFILSQNNFPLSKNKSDDDVVSSQGVFNTTFNDILTGFSSENGSVQPDATFKVGAVNTRRVATRNTPSVINAVYTYRNNWDGKANPVFNGVNTFGPKDPDAKVFKVIGGTITQVNVAIPFSSLASQAVGPPLNKTEMSFDGRTFVKLGKKILNLRPLARQLVSLTDSKLGSVSASPQPGLVAGVTYKSMIQDAFNQQWWNSDKIITFENGVAGISDNPGRPLSTTEYTLMEVNFSLFWGLALQLYQSTLVSDNSKFDRFREGTATLTTQEQNGLNLFMGKGKCINCHSGPEFTNASVTAKNKFGAVDRMIMKNGNPALYDVGFYNIAIRATNEDISNGDIFLNVPLSFSKQLSNGIQVDTFSFNTSKFQIPGAIQPNERVAVNGAFKVPSLRNVELTGPYFHNGGKATLKELLIAYNAGNLFRNENLSDMPPDITALNLTGTEENDIIAFLLTLTDDRVRNQQAPFDHPQIFLPNGHPGDQNSVTNDGTGKATDSFIEFAAVGSAGGNPISSFLNSNQFLGKGGAEIGDTGDELEETIPDKFTLEQNFPNPFNPNTIIQYKLAAAGKVTLIIYNLLGQEVTRLVDEFQDHGQYSVSWNAGSFSSGIYIYKITVRSENGFNNFVDVKKMLLIK